MRFIRAFGTVGVGLLLTVVSMGQMAVSSKSSEKKLANESRKDLQNEVRSLLILLASDAMSFRDQSLRAGSLAQIADLVWTFDPDQGKRLFRTAWEAAQIADQSDTPYNLGENPPNLRHEVLKLTALHDRLLAEEFLKKLRVEESTGAENSATNPNGSAGVLEQRLLLANELLRNGDTKRALEFAGPVLENVSIGAIEFLTNLRLKDRAAADSSYMSLLATVRDGMDANSISLLSSYLFTPHRYVTFNTEGAGDRIGFATSEAPIEVEPSLRLTFFQAASEFLLKAQARSKQEDASETLRDYVTLRQLLSSFEAYAPVELTQTLRAAIEEMSSTIKQSLQTESQQRVETEDPKTDQAKTLLEKIDRARTSAERDELYFRLASLSLNRDDIQARDYVSKIEESSFRKQAQAWVDINLAVNAIKKKRIDAALQFARAESLSPIQKVWIFTQSAELLAKSDPEKASSLLESATNEARRLEGAGLDRPRGLFAIAHATRLIGSDRTRETVYDAVKAANSAEGFTGEGGVLSLSIRSNGQIRVKTVAVPEFDIAGIFEDIANSDFDTAVQLARGFQGDAPRTHATIAISRSIIRKQTNKTGSPGMIGEH